VALVHLDTKVTAPFAVLSALVQSTTVAVIRPPSAMTILQSAARTFRASVGRDGQVTDSAANGAFQVVAVLGVAVEVAG